MSDKIEESRSNLATLPGILILLIAFILTAYVKMEGLPIFILIVLLISVTSYLWGKYSLKKMKVDAEPIITRVFPGEDLVFKLSIENDKALPLLWLESDYFEEDPAFLYSEEEFKHRFTWVLSYQKVVGEIRIKAKSRGLVVMNSIGLSSGDGFGLSFDKAEYPLDGSFLLVSYPEVFHLDAAELIRDTAQIEPGERGYVDDYTLFRGSRDYMPEDSTRFINWRMLAREGKLSVNLYEPIVPQSIAFLLDLSSFALWKDETTNAGVVSVMQEFHSEIFEEMISLVASAIVALTERKIRCSLIIPKIVEGKGQILANSESIDTQIPDLLTELSAIEYKGEETSFDRHEILSRSHSFGDVFVVSESADALTCRKLLEGFESYQLNLLTYYDGNDSYITRVKTLEELRRSYV